MNNRHGGASARNAGGLSRARAASAQTAFAATSSTSQTTSSSSVRRNLFQNQLTRRPTPASSAEASSQEKEAFTISSGGGSDLSDIVVRGRNGEIELDETPLVPVEGDADEVAIDMMVENQRERQRLADAVKHHHSQRSSVPDDQPEELLEAIQASNRAKVAALAEDNWMFEKEDSLRD